MINYSFISPKVLRDLEDFPQTDKRAKALRIHNPLSEDQSVMRTTLIPGLLQAVRTNAHRQNLDLKLFELGRVFFPAEGEDLPEEMETLAGLLSGLREEESWSKPKAKCDFFDLKGTLEALFDGLGVPDFISSRNRQIPFLHPGKACRVEVGGEEVGIMGEIHPDVGELFDLKEKVFLFELNFQKLIAKDHRAPSF